MLGISKLGIRQDRKGKGTYDNDIGDIDVTSIF